MGGEKPWGLQWGTKFLGQLTPSALIFPPFPLSPKQCCSLCTHVHFTPVLKVFLHSNIVWRGEGRASRGIQVFREVYIMLLLNI